MQKSWPPLRSRQRVVSACLVVAAVHRTAQWTIVQTIIYFELHPHPELQIVCDFLKTQRLDKNLETCFVFIKNED